MHAQLRIHHRVRVAAHAAGTGRVVDGLGLGPHELGQLRVGQVLARRMDRRAAVAVEGRLRQQLAGEPGALDHHAQIEALRVGQVVGLDPHRAARVGVAQQDAAAAARAQEAGVHGQAVAGQAVAAVVVEHGRDEVELHVRAVVGGQGRAYEAAGLGDVAGAGAAAATQEVVEGDLQLAGTVVAQARRAVAQGADDQVVLQVGAHPGQVGLHLDAVQAQVRGRADAREHQQLR